ncbi:OmpA family protein [Pseudorhodoferax sp.]|uniref:OmpA family protein n=1 Tax=Pseudorhodoferax sp. TaxID=1993553 RepID=UPI0039E5C062
MASLIHRPGAWAAVAALALLAPAAWAQQGRPAAAGASAPPAAAARPTGAATQPGMVVVAGTVPDEAARQAIIGRMRELYGADRVVDHLGVGNLVAPPNWAQHVQRMLTPELKQVSRGQITIQGNVVEVKGEVRNEAVRQQLVSTLSTQINNPTYTVRNGLRVAGPGQEQVDAALANRIIEFETGSAQLTAGGQGVLDQLVPVLRQLQGRKFEIIGHTDAQGARATNVALSIARAESVKTYLVGKGLPELAFSTSGVGPDRPVAGNDTAEGRARNRRIEFRVGQ